MSFPRRVLFSSLPALLLCLLVIVFSARAQTPEGATPRSQEPPRPVATALSTSNIVTPAEANMATANTATANTATANAATPGIPSAASTTPAPQAAPRGRTQSERTQSEPTQSESKPAIAPATASAAPQTMTEEFVRRRSGSLGQRMQSLFGLGVFLLLCYGLGQMRRPRVQPLLRTVLWGVALQFAFAIIVLRLPGFFGAINGAVNSLLEFSSEGARFLFGNLTNNNVPVGSPLDPGAATMGPLTKTSTFANTGAYFAFTVLPTIIFFSALSTLLYYLNVLQPVVRFLAVIMQRTMGTSGSETLSATANIFLGQTEAPLFVRPFIAKATQSELMAIMTGGFSNIASGVLAAYVAMLSGFAPDIAGHLLSASIISAPASLVVAKLLLPETQTSETSGKVKLHVEKTDANFVDAAARGSIEGLQLALNVGAMLLVFTALVAMCNALLGWFGTQLHLQLPANQPLSLQYLLGWVGAPVAWLLGVPWEQCSKVGSLLGIKTVINEFVAYLQLATSMGADRNFLDPRSFLLAAYALCGFANFASIAIQIGGIGSMAPERRADLSRLGFISMLGGAIASCMTACVIGVLLS